MTRDRLVPLALAAAAVVVAAIFAARPDIDLAVAQGFYRGENRFVAQTPLGDAVRRVLYWIPTAVLLAFTALWLAQRLGRTVAWAPTGRGVLFLFLTFAIGPGLLVNAVLKDHSHRPRPYQTEAFGGTMSFRPFHRFDGACKRNCSFVSGEGSAAAWTLAPALLLPPPVRLAAVVASLAYAASAGMLRMAFGGHYLSDTLFAVLLVWTVIWVGRRLLWPARDRAEPPT